MSVESAINSGERGKPVVVSPWALEAHRVFEILGLPAAAELDEFKGWLDGDRDELPRGVLRRLGSQDALGTVFMFVGDDARAMLREHDETVLLFAAWSYSWPLNLFVPTDIMSLITGELADIHTKSHRFSWWTR